MKNLFKNYIFCLDEKIKNLDHELQNVTEVQLRIVIIQEKISLRNETTARIQLLNSLLKEKESKNRKKKN